MAQQTVNIGTTANDGTGDTIRAGGDKINDNFTELYKGTEIIAPAGNWVILSDVGSEMITLTSWANINANSMRLFPVRIWREMTLSDLAVDLDVAQASSNFALAFYAADATTGLPTGTPLFNTGDISGAVAGVLSADIADVVSYTLAPGIYYCAIWVDTSGLDFRMLNRNDVSLLATALGHTDPAQLSVSNATYTGFTINSTAAGTFDSTNWADITGDVALSNHSDNAEPLLMAKLA